MRIIVYNNWSVVKNVNQEEREIIADILRYKVKNAYFSPRFKSGNWDGTKTLLTKNNAFPTGFLPTIYARFNYADIVFAETEHIKPLKINLDALKQYKTGYQYEDYKDIIFNKLAGKRFVKGIIKGATGYGKSFLIKHLLKAYRKHKCLLILPNQDLFKQTKTDLSAFNLEYGVLDHTDTSKYKNIMIGKVQTINNRLKEDENVQHWFKNNIKVIIADECHLAAGPSFSNIIYSTDASVKLGFSATPFDNKDDERNYTVRGAFGNCIVDRDMTYLTQEAKSVTPVEVHMHKIKHKGIVSNKRKAKELYIQNSELRANVIKKYMEYPNHMLLCVQYKKHGKHLANSLKAYQLFCDQKNVVEEIYAESDEFIKEDFLSGNINIGITTLFKEGMNAPSINILGYMRGGDNITAIKQYIGRGVRQHSYKSKLIVIDFIDDIKYLKSESTFRLKLYKKEGYEIKIFE